MAQTDGRKGEIIQMASKLFRERGYSAVSMRDLAAGIGVKAASLYNHISSKQEILSSIIISIAERFTEGMNAIVSKKVSVKNKLEEMIDHHIQVMIDNPDGIACLNNDWVHLKEPELTYFLDMRNGYEENLRKILKEGIKSKEIKQVNVEVMLFSMLSTLRTLHLLHEKKKGIKSDNLKNEVKQILLTGIMN